MTQYKDNVQKIIEMIKKAKCVFCYVSISDHDGRYFRIYKSDILEQIKQDRIQGKGYFYDIEKLTTNMENHLYIG